MNPTSHRSTRVARLQFALAFCSALFAPVAQAGARREAPPAFADSAHVSNGCHLSSITFLAKFLGQFPGERGEPLVIQMINSDGVRRPHTVAVLTWQGQTWCRDEYFGVFVVDCSVAAQSDKARLVAKVQTALERHAAELIRTAGMSLRPAPPAKMSAEQRAAEVTTMATIIPFPTTIYWVRSGSREVPLAFFRPNAREIAVYDPQHGTCLAKCPSRDDAKIVALAAAQLGYHVDAVRPDLPAVRATLLAATELPSAGLAQ